MPIGSDDDGDVQMEAPVAGDASDDDDDGASSSSSSSSGSDFEEVQATAEDAERITALEEQLAGNPYLYEAHVQARVRASSTTAGDGRRPLAHERCACACTDSH